ncbi:DUF4258 domain-containing protein [Crenobacter intestini]|uniref:DUF4258 domain-containing protein n=1 Tax=Crenobacter intestini TaxID=2563443 RepID=A0A4T0UIX1_9NEIS|nr:DUF4258 domain-containing protein [Crenobacter intestini]
MHTTHHCKARQTQRGISPKMVDYVIEHGRSSNDKVVLDINEVDRLLADLDAQRSLLLKIRDKGGVVVVEQGGVAITTYNRQRRNRFRQH